MTGDRWTARDGDLRSMRRRMTDDGESVVSLDHGQRVCAERPGRPRLLGRSVRLAAATDEDHDLVIHAKPERGQAPGPPVQSTLELPHGMGRTLRRCLADRVVGFDRAIRTQPVPRPRHRSAIVGLALSATAHE